LEHREQKQSAGVNLGGVGKLGDDSRLVFRQNVPIEEWHVNGCTVVVLHPGLVSPPLKPIDAHFFIKFTDSYAAIFRNHSAHYLNFLYFKIGKSRRMRWAGHVARMGEKRNVFRLLVGKPEGKRPLGRVDG
jgi:hypothetical protein